MRYAAAAVDFSNGKQDAAVMAKMTAMITQMTAREPRILNHDALYGKATQGTENIKNNDIQAKIYNEK